MIVFSAVADPRGRKGARDPQSGLKQNFKRKRLVLKRVSLTFMRNLFLDKKLN